LPLHIPARAGLTPFPSLKHLRACVRAQAWWSMDTAPDLKEQGKGIATGPHQAGKLQLS
jgi:hypothetical protein